MPKVLPELMTTITMQTSEELIPLIKIKGIRSAIMDQSIVTRTTVVIHTDRDSDHHHLQASRSASTIPAEPWFLVIQHLTCSDFDVESTAECIGCSTPSVTFALTSAADSL